MIYILSEKIYDGADNLPVIQIKNITKDIDYGKYDALVFTSKNGVLAVQEDIEKWKDIDVYSIGSATSSVIEALGARVVYSARNSYGNSFATEIKKLLAGKKVLFLRAKKVTSKLNHILKEAGVLLDEAVVYETVCAECKELKTPPKNSKIIFSSPSTIECFFKCFLWDESYKAVVIGTVTAEFMPEGIKYDMAEKPNIPSCIELAKTL